MSLEKIVLDYEKPTERDEVLRDFLRTDPELGFYGESALESYLSLTSVDKAVSDMTGFEPAAAQYPNHSFYAAHEVLKMQRVKEYMSMSTEEILRGVSFSEVSSDSEDGKSIFFERVNESAKPTVVLFYDDRYETKQKAAIMLKELYDRYSGVNFVACYTPIAPEHIKGKQGNADNLAVAVYAPYSAEPKVFFRNDAKIRQADVLNKDLTAYDFITICRDYAGNGKEDSGMNRMDNFSR